MLTNFYCCSGKEETISYESLPVPTSDQGKLGCLGASQVYPPHRNLMRKDTKFQGQSDKVLVVLSAGKMLAPQTCRLRQLGQTTRETTKGYEATWCHVAVM